MPETLYIGSDINAAETKVLFDERDFFDLVDQYMGHDARRYVERLITADKQSLEDAYMKGRAEGLEEGTDSDSQLAYENGHEDGYDEGYDDGYAKGYAEGFEEGYKKHNPFS